MIRLFMATAFVLSTALTSSCTNQAEAVAAAPINKVCPIMGGKVTPEGGSTTWNDELIGFCCASCIPDWNELSDEEKASKLAEANRGELNDDEPGDQPHGG